MDLTIYHCGETYHTDSSNIGKQIRCGQCGELFTIEAPSVPVEVHAEVTAEPVSGMRVPDYPLGPSSKIFPWQKVIKGAIPILLFLFVLAYQHYTEPTPSGAPSLPETEGGTAVVSQPETSSTPDAIPQAADLPTRSLPNGTDISEPVDVSGRGKLEVTNGTGYDGFVKLTEGAVVRRRTYVTAGNSITLSGISECNCRVMFVTGVDFDGETFMRHASYLVYDESFDFSLERADGIISVPFWKITLNPVIGGNARTHKISKEEFLAAKSP